MLYESIKLTGYIGIMQGTRLNEIFIDFRQCKHGIIMIKGDNGSGKSSLLRAISPFPDSSSQFIPKTYAEKEIVIYDDSDGSRYKITCVHQVGRDGSRSQAKAYIKRMKPEENSYCELNETGTIRSFMDTLMNILNLDQNYIALSALSTEDKGIVNKTPAERSKYVSRIIEETVTYDNMLKIFTKRNSVNRSMINNISYKIDNIGNPETIHSTLQSLEGRIANIEARKEVLQKVMSDADSTIKILDPDLSIQNRHAELLVNCSKADTGINKLNETLRKIFDSNPYGLNRNVCTDIQACSMLYYEKKSAIYSVTNTINELQDKLSTIIVSNEEESKALELKIQRINSLRSETNFTDIKAMMDLYNSNVAEYESFFKMANITDAINISKDEYILGLNTMKDIKDTIDAFKSFQFNDIISRSIDYIIANIDVGHIYTTAINDLETMKQKLNDYRSSFEYYQGLLDKTIVLEQRPTTCSDDMCPFIKDALVAARKEPERLMNEIQEASVQLDNAIVAKTIEVEELKECVSCIRDIKIILRNIDNNANILKKLPNSHIFLNKSVFYEKLKNGNTFSEIDQLYQYINYANIFEEYKKAKDILYKLEVDYKLYQSKAEIIDELDRDIKSLESKISNMVSEITSLNERILQCKKTVNESQGYFETLDTIINTMKELEDLYLSKEDYQIQLNTIAMNMDKIKEHINSKNKAYEEFRAISNTLLALTKDKDTLNYQLNMLKQYTEELEVIRQSYDKIEVLKSYTTPSKKGIQNIFIVSYMNQTRSLANQILGLFFDGRLQLDNFIIKDGIFAMPCTSSYSGLATDDISSCSRSESTMASLAVSTAMLKQSSTKFNILKLDEIDEGLDQNNRLMYINAINTIREMLSIQQIIMVSHSSELGLGNVDIIKLRCDNDTVTANEGNIIFSL